MWLTLPWHSTQLMPAFTCAACHFGRLPDGRYAVGYGNMAFDYGLMIAGLTAAYISTIITHLNWGTSYLVHDFYRRFINRTANEDHYVFMGRVATLLLFVCSSATVYLLDTAKDAFDIILQIGAGTGLPGIVEVHDLHVWEVTSGFPALAAHVRVAPGDDCHARRRLLQRFLREARAAAAMFSTVSRLRV